MESRELLTVTLSLLILKTRRIYHHLCKVKENTMFHLHERRGMLASEYEHPISWENQPSTNVLQKSLLCQVMCNYKCFGLYKVFAFLFSALLFKLGLNRLPEKEAIILLHVLSKLLIELVTELILFFSKFLFLFHFRPRIDLNGKWYFIGLQLQYIFFRHQHFSFTLRFGGLVHFDQHTLRKSLSFSPMYCKHVGTKSVSTTMLMCK